MYDRRLAPSPSGGNPTPAPREMRSQVARTAPTPLDLCTDGNLSHDMARQLRVRTIAALAHACVFTIISCLSFGLHYPLMEGPMGVPSVLFYVVDIPISLVAFGFMFFSAKFAWLAWILWGVLGTGWWYLLGISIEAWIKRLSKWNEKRDG